MATACSHPIRLRGSHERIDAETGELLAQIITARNPGGKGVPEAVAVHPAVMVTLTAPSFGPVHTIRDRDGSCPCGGRHAVDDDALGTPVDPATYRYLEQAIWNHLAPTLWKRTVQATRRNLANELGVARHRLGTVARVRFVKAAEFQRRGTVHYHAVIRLDGPGKHVLSDPPARCTVTLLERVIRDAARNVEVNARGQRIGWGREIKIVRLDPLGVGRAAGYVAKYATKSTEIAADGLLLRRVRSWRELVSLDAPEHAKRLVEAAWRAGAIDGLERARRWAHQFGYGGHTLTKSHDYSLTFGALRDARAEWRSGRPARVSRPVITRGRLAYAGRAQRLAIPHVDGSGRNLGAV